jgi:hypothetical protein
MNNLTIRITFGNDAMQDTLDAASALESDVIPALYVGRTSGIIRDINGNTVGSWETN